MSRRFVTLPETIAIRDLLAQHLHRSQLKTPEGIHVWVYDKGWDDQAIARTVSPELNRGHVLTIRQELFGPIKGAVPEPKHKTSNPPAGKIEALETRVSNLERLVRYLCNQFDIPCDPNTGT